MPLRRLALVLCGMVTALILAAPAFAYDDWRWQGRPEGGQPEAGQHEWREHEWREHQARQPSWPFSPVVRPYGNHAPPVFAHNPTFFR